MTRLRNLIAAAAALVIGGATVAVAIYQAGQSASPRWTCAEWATSVDAWQDAQRSERAIVAIKQGAAIPRAVGDRLLGDCAAGTCTVQPQGCAAAVTYSYQAGPATNLGAAGTWTLYEVRAPLYFLGAWKAAATADPVNIRFFAAFGEAVAACRALTTAANCLTLFAADARCWLLTDGRTCDHGKMYGPGLGGSLVCDYSLVKAPMPCVVDRGAGSELVDAARTYTAEELQ